MKRIDKTSVRFRADDDSVLVVHYDNKGDPYREGITVSLEIPGATYATYGGHFFLEDREARRLRDLLNQLYPVKP